MRGSRVTLVAALVASIGAAIAYPDIAHAVEAGTAAYLPVGPLRLADTRAPECGCTRPSPGTIRVDVAGRPAMPGGVRAAAVTITALPTAEPGYATAYPGGTARPATSTVNTTTDRALANSAIVPVGADGTVDVFSSTAGDIVVDVTGVFLAAGEAAAGRLIPLAPTRLADTRTTTALAPGGELTVQLPAGVPADATALAVNVTSVGEPAPGFLAARPAGTASGTPTSFLNTDGSGRVVASAAILAVSAAGLTLTSHSGGHVIVDVTGWFTGPSAAESTAGLFVPLTPQRLHDTRSTPPRLAAGGTIRLASPVAAAALVTNLTVTGPDWRGFVTAYPANTPRPSASAVNARHHDHTVANLAITPTSTAGVAYYGLAGTDLIVDLTGYFTGQPVPATEPPAANAPTPPRMLVIGDSAMAGLDDAYPDGKVLLSWADVVFDADNCRRLVYRSCLSNVTNRIPNTALEAIASATGRFDVVYIAVGHNDWFDADFDWQFSRIVEASRGLGAKVILWGTYAEQPILRPGTLYAYAWNNVAIRRLASQSHYDDVLIADWSGYAAAHPDWFWDGTHVRPDGAWALAGFLSDQLAGIVHRR